MASGSRMSRATTPWRWTRRWAICSRSVTPGSGFFSGSGGGAANKWINAVWRALRPFASGQAYQNYIDPQLPSWARAYYASNLPRLRQIKKQVDPDFRFRFRQAIPPAP